jgi:hypothetical protein
VFLVLAKAALAQADVKIVEFSGGSDGIGCGDGACGPGAYTVTPGGHAVFYLQVMNSGPSLATNVIATVTFPPHAIIDHITSLLGAASCSSSFVGTNPVVTCTQASMGPNALFSLGIGLNLNADYPWQGGLSVSAVVVSDAIDPVVSNNNAGVNVYVAPPAGAAAAPVLDNWSVMCFAALLALVGMWRMSKG